MEHIVPKSNYGLATIHKVAASKKLSASQKDAKIKEIVKEQMLVCFVTDSENEKLNGVGRKFMPDTFSEKKKNFFARYEAAFDMTEEELKRKFFVEIKSIKVENGYIKIN